MPPDCGIVIVVVLCDLYLSPARPVTITELPPLLTTVAPLNIISLTWPNVDVPSPTDKNPVNPDIEIVPPVLLNNSNVVVAL